MKHFQAILTFMRGINPLTKIASDGSVEGRSPRMTKPTAKLKGLFILNPKPFVIAELELLVQAYNPALVVRHSEATMRDNKLIPAMLWVGQDFADNTDEELLAFTDSL